MKNILILFTVVFITIGVLKIFKTDHSPITINLQLEKKHSTKLNKHSFGWIVDQTKEDDLTILSDSVIVHDYDIKIEINNTGKKNVYFWLMNCSWEQNFEINNDYVVFYNKGCDKNFPALFKIKPNSTITLNGVLRKDLKFDYDPHYEDRNFDNQVLQTKLGLIIIDDIYNPKLKMVDYNLDIKDKSKHKIIWSNGINLINN